MEFKSYLSEDSYLQESFFENHFNKKIKKNILTKLDKIEINLAKSAALSKKQGRKEEYLKIKEALEKAISQKEALKKMRYEENKFVAIFTSLESMLTILVHLGLVGGLIHASATTGFTGVPGIVTILAPASLVGVAPLTMFYIVIVTLLAGWMISAILVKKFENKMSHEAAKIKVQTIVSKTNEKIRKYMK